MSTQNAFKKGLNNFWLVSSIAIGSIYVVKTIINRRRDQEYQTELYDDIPKQKIRPGFKESSGEYQRKSEFEGAGNAYSSRVKGDRFSGLLDMSWIFGKDDGEK
ncbi:hypothetical protein WICMUC_002977 [Wickerhamomyces mucosus]|uniref:Uncharacterized protein n=1 Tax=Wickerhamomyces mucosus TaxID=1378264 RepID=A0A9P8PP15_9ASCO|nr:hypothetical protein WICMUC_002977 [Wickerhamomyces mucosus]